MKAIGLRMVQAGHRLSLGPARRRFERALCGCEAAQAVRLRELVTANADTAYGRAHRFDAISSVRDWQGRVPIVDYDALEPWVRRAAAGEPRVLTAAPVRVFERTGGSTAANKLVPYTAALFDEFAAATGPWLHDLYASFPGLRGTTSYWSISPATRQSERTTAGIPVGLDDDTEYFGPLERFALRRMLAVPPRVARIPDMDAWANATARHLVAASNLGLISVWHPSFFVLLLRRIETSLDALLDDVSARRRAAVRRRLQHGTLGEALWPQLAVVSCWADAAAGDAVPTLHRYVPHARIQPKGLLATEGVVSLPLQLENVSRPPEGGHYDETIHSVRLQADRRLAEAGQPDRTVSVAAIAGHFLEFLDLEHPAAPAVLAHELKRGAVYAPVISTGGGFYRYKLGDAVRCSGFHLQAPLLHFEGRIDQVSDLCGEKLNPRMVAQALGYAAQATGATLTFALLAPAAGDPPGYRLYAEGVDATTLQNVCDAVERTLCDSHGYRYARALGQLTAIQGVPVRNGAARYLHARAEAGQRAGDIKPAHLDDGLDWSVVFEGAAREPLVSAEVTR
jgi:hypothetical protein